MNKGTRLSSGIPSREGRLRCSPTGVVGDAYEVPKKSSPPTVRGGEKVGEKVWVGGEDEKEFVLRGLLFEAYRKDEGLCCCCICIAADNGDPA